jgi:hypothetical protein
MLSVGFEIAISANQKAADLRLRPHNNLDRLGFISTHFSSFILVIGVPNSMRIRVLCKKSFLIESWAFLKFVNSLCAVPYGFILT